jgi:hypothetical protein
MNDARSAGRLAIALACLALAAGFVRAKLVASPARTDGITSGDLLAYYAPMLDWGVRRLRAGDVPLWNPRQSCGTPFLAIPQIGLFYPLYLPFLVVPASLAVPLDTVLHLAIAALGTVLLCRHLGMRREAAVLGGIVYAFQASMILKVYFANFLAPVAWFPLLVLLVDRLLARPAARDVAALGAVVAASLLSANVQFLYYEGLALVPLALVRVATTARADGRRAVAGVGAVGAATAIGVAAALVRILPAAAFMRGSWRPPGGLTRAMASIMAISPAELARDVLGPQPVPDVRRQAYVGMVPLALAASGLLCWRRRGIAIALAVAGAGAVFYAFGSPGVVFDAPRGLIVFGFAIAILAAGGFEAIAGRRRPWVAVAVFAVAAAACVAGVRAVAGDTTRAVAYDVAGLACLLLVVLGRGGWRALAAVGVAAIVLADLSHAEWPERAFPVPLRAASPRYETLFETIRARQGFERTYLLNGFLPSNPFRFHSDLAKAGMNHGLWLATDYEALCPARTATYQGALGPGLPICYTRFVLSSDNVALAELMGLRYWLVPDGSERALVPDAGWFASRWRRVASEAGVTLWEYGGWVGRAFLAERVVVEPRPDVLLERLAGADVRRVAFVEEPAAEAPGDREGGDARDADDAAKITTYEPERVTIETASAAPRFLVLTDQYDAGWRATVDGRAVAIHRTDYLFRGVAVPAGRHRVEMVYRPWTFVVGLAGSVAGIVAIAALALRRASSRR